ncbi:MAG: phosphotransferase, partial [Bacteroidota bacterium]
MSLYSQLNTKAIHRLAQNYEIGPIQSWKLLQGGSENTNYLLATEKEKYVLTLCERKTVEEASILAELLNHIEKNNFKSSTIIANKQKSPLSFYQEKPILLKRYIDGSIIAVMDEQTVF